jgi:hypothetical protein
MNFIAQFGSRPKWMEIIEPQKLSLVPETGKKIERGDGTK